MIEDVMTGNAREAGTVGAAGMPLRVSLASFKTSGFFRGRSVFVEALWILVQALFVSSFLPGSAHRRFLLRLFGAQIGKRVTVKPGVRVKFPWRFITADNVWIGEDVWIDNLATVTIEANVCISQGSYLCTGSHDWSSTTFDLITRPIIVRYSAWIAAKACVGPGVVIGEGAVLTLGSSAYSDLDPWSIYAGTPAQRIKQRLLQI
jgi:putative colanic acid biosynthesis acetyltransferase WcaF